MKLAIENKLSSISFPSISTGAYGYPVAPAARIALSTVATFLKETSSVKEVTFVLFDSRTFDAYSAALSEIAKQLP